MEKLDELEKEEELREQAGYYDNEESEEDDEMKEIRHTAGRIREKKKLITIESNEKRKVEKPRLPRTAKKVDRSRLEGEMEGLGLEISNKDETHYGRQKSRSASRKPLKRKREDGSVIGRSRTRSASRTPRDKSGVRDEVMAKKVRKIAKKAQGPANRNAKKGEADRVILNMMPKHLYAGKRKQGKTDRR